MTSLIRSLPKNLRVSFVPAPNRAREFLRRRAGRGRSRCWRPSSGTSAPPPGCVVPREAWDWAKVPEHLRPTYRVVDDGGREQARGKDLEALKEPLRPTFAAAMAEVAADSGVTATGQTAWTFGAVEASFTQRRAGHEVRGYPGSRGRGRRPSGWAVFGSAEEQEARHRLGVRRLLLLDHALAGAGGARLARQRAEARPGRLAVPVGRRAAGGLPGRGRPGRGGRAATGARRGRLRGAAPCGHRGPGGHLRAVLGDVLRVLEGWRAAEKLLSGRAEMVLLPALTDMRDQLARLVPRGFVAEAGTAALRRYPTYLAAIAQRHQRLTTGGAAAVNRDRTLMDQVVDLQAAWLHRVEALPAGTPPGEPLRRVRWMLEELRVSLFAQQLGTAYPVSDQRIRKALASSS